MICPHCQDAGEWNHAANQMRDSKHEVTKACLDNAKMEHAKCRNNEVKPAGKKDPASDKSRLTTWCDCAHKTGQYVNSSLIREAEKDTNATIE